MKRNYKINTMEMYILYYEFAQFNGIRFSRIHEFAGIFCSIEIYSYYGTSKSILLQMKLNIFKFTNKLLKNLLLILSLSSSAFKEPAS